MRNMEQGLLQILARTELLVGAGGMRWRQFGQAGACEDRRAHHAWQPVDGEGNHAHGVHGRTGVDAPGGALALSRNRGSNGDDIAWRHAWRATLLRRRSLWLIAAAILLSALWLALLIVCLSPEERARVRPFDPRWAEFVAPVDLPGSPLAEQSVRATPAAIEGEEAASRNAKAPFLALGPAALPFHLTGSPKDHVQARACLAAAMLYEAGGDAVGQLAVGQVVLNRVRHPAFPASVCGVVTQGSERATGCQFTFTCDGALSRSYAGAAVSGALDRAELMLNGMVYPGVGLATHYHTEQVYPWWSPRLEKIARVGSHLFFRWPGFWGSATATRGKRRAPEPATGLFGQFGAKSFPQEPLPAAPNIPYIEGQGSIFDEQVPRGSAQAVAQAVGSRDLVTGTGAGSAAAVPPSRRLAAAWQRPVGVAVPLAASPALEGMRLLRISAERDVFLVELARGSSEAARRRTAQALCGGRPRCSVYGWHGSADAPSGFSSEAIKKAQPEFSFVREPPRDARAVPPSANAL